MEWEHNQMTLRERALIKYRLTVVVLFLLYYHIFVMYDLFF